ncbi:MAG: hypothetical protein IID14_08755, partial [Candidatus Marinimicrobia bacterium]|nr:hypothetical protein [Candidatus Neomarinimicrobiota bacterium]
MDSVRWRSWAGDESRSSRSWQCQLVLPTVTPSPVTSPMPDRSSLIPQALTYLVLGFAGALAMGLLFHGTGLIHPTHPAFRFLTLGLAGAVTYSVVVFGRRKWYALMPLALITVVDVSLVGITTVSQLGSRVF